MARLTLLNGPPGIGKSTLARLYVDSHPGVLDLDIDQISGLIGGWRDDFSATIGVARTDALAMAEGHLRQGLDVLVPQYVGRMDQFERFEAVARDTGASFRHVVLMDTRESVVERFTGRGQRGETEWHRHAQEVVERDGGAQAVSAMFDALAAVVRERLTSILVTSEPGAIESTYEAVVQAIDTTVKETPPRAVAVVVRDNRVLVIRRRRKGLKYAVLPGGGVEPGETARDAAVRELREETSLVAGSARQIWHRHDSGREATYFLCGEAQGSAVLSGEESLEHCADNGFELHWVGAETFDAIRLQPIEIRALLSGLLGSPAC